MFGNNDHDNQQQDSGFGSAATQNDPMSVSDETLGNHTTDDGSTPSKPTTDDSGFVVPDASAPIVPSTDPSTFADSPAAGQDDNNDLMSIKQGALEKLTPLVSHLDQTPEEKFRTTMMMIQASDNQSLIKDAYEAAQKISDDKARAQALLDVINEINYFTQHNK